jgi:hypothetical protein
MEVRRGACCCYKEGRGKGSGNDGAAPFEKGHGRGTMWRQGDGGGGSRPVRA